LDDDKNEFPTSAARRRALPRPLLLPLLLLLLPPLLLAALLWPACAHATLVQAGVAWPNADFYVNDYAPYQVPPRVWVLPTPPADARRLPRAGLRQLDGRRLDGAVHAGGRQRAGRGAGRGAVGGHGGGARCAFGDPLASLTPPFPPRSTALAPARASSSSPACPPPRCRDW
jgi:hypothetical protein